MSDVRDCETCGATDVRVKRDGTLWKHRDSDVGDTCTQEVPDPAPVLMICDCGITWQGTPQQGHGMMACEPVSDQAPNPQRYCVAIDCDAPVTEPGAYRCDDHLCGRSTNCLDCWEGGVEPVSDQAPTVGAVDEDEAGIECGGTTMALAMDTKTEPQDPAEAFLFEDPSPAAAPTSNIVVRGKYQIKDPATGEFRRFKNGNVKGFTRATTFIKYGQDSKGLNDWGKRNIAIGAAKRPDIAARAWGKTHKDDKALLDDVVDQLQEAANAKVSAEMGSDLHEWRERLDGRQCTLDDVPPQWRTYLANYVQGLRERGLVAVPGMSERITMIREFGGVAGRMDDIYFHEPSGRYYVGDLKTGKTLDYGKKEIPGQLWIYAHGLNQNGVYDEQRHEWDRYPGDPRILNDPVRVSEETGLVMWMPVDGEHAGQFYVRRADLVHGRAFAELCDRNRSFPNPAWEDWEPVPQADPDDPNVARKEATWAERFASVNSNESATALWREAKQAGIEGVGLNELIEIARQALRDKG